MPEVFYLHNVQFVIDSLYQDRNSNCVNL